MDFEIKWYAMISAAVGIGLVMVGIFGDSTPFLLLGGGMVGIAAQSDI